LERELRKQGDQIGRIFAHWAIVFFKQFLKMIEVAQNFGLHFHIKGFTSILIKSGLGFILGDFSQIHLVTLSIRHYGTKN
jgi:hypothetical protein